MKDKLSRLLLWVCPLLFGVAVAGLVFRREPFYTHFFLFAWGSAIGGTDAWLYRNGGDSILVDRPLDFAGFLVPFSALLWFLFEAINLRLRDWVYVGVPSETWIRWPGYFFAFGTVLPGIFIAANALEKLSVFPRNDFSAFFSEPIPPWVRRVLSSAGAAMLLLPLVFPRAFFPLVWGAFVFLLDPWNAAGRRRSLFQEWRQGNWNRTLQLLLAGAICGFLWELWNFWAGAKWAYTVPLPEALLSRLKIFEMPVLGFLGFPPFALECFVMAEWARAQLERCGPAGRRMVWAAAFISMGLVARAMDARTVLAFR